MKQDFRKNRDMYWRNNAAGYNTNVNPKTHLAMIILLAAVLIVAIASAALGGKHKQPDIDFQMINTEHFSMMYTEKDKTYIDTFSTDMENYYKKLTDDLKILKPLKIAVKLYPDKTSFREALGNPNWPDYMPAAGVAPGEIRMISLSSADIGCTRQEAMTYTASQLAYCIVAGTAQKIPPAWMLNTFVTYEVGGINEEDKNVILQKSSIHSLRDFNSITEQETAYSAYTAGEYIVGKWGTDALAELINTGGDIKLVLGKSEAEFEKEWQEYVQTKYK